MDEYAKLSEEEFKNIVNKDFNELVNRNKIEESILIYIDV